MRSNYSQCITICKTGTKQHYCLVKLVKYPVFNLSSNETNEIYLINFIIITFLIIQLFRLFEDFQINIFVENTTPY